MYKYAPTIVALIGFSLLILGITSSAFIFPKIIQNAIQESIALKEGTEAYEVWKKQPFPLKFKIYFFHILNPSEIQNGENPIIKEKGPYVYDQYREKINISINEYKDTIRYILRKTFFFNEEDSGCRTEDDVVTIINPAIVGTALQVEGIMPSAVPMISDAIPYLFPGTKDIFLRAKVKDVLFDGIPLYCHDKEVAFVCGAMKNQLPPTMRQHSNGQDYLFSLFNHLNVTGDGPYEMERGIRNTKRGEIIAFQDNTNLDLWNSNTCNMINGSDSTVFRPITDTTKKERLYAFASDFCRSLYTEYEKETESFDIPTIRYATTAESLAANDQNKCFCPEDEDDDGNTIVECTPNGTMDVTPCVKAPIIISYPHFYLGDASLLRYVTGLNPRKNLHETFVELEPRTGTPIVGKKRIQMNIHLKPIPAFELMANVSEGIFPIIWLEEGVELPPSVINKLKGEFSKMKLLELIKWFLSASGIALMISAFIMILYKENLLCFDNTSRVSADNGKKINNRTINVEVIADGNMMMYPGLYPQMNHRNVNDGLIKRP